VGNHEAKPIKRKTTSGRSRKNPVGAPDTGCKESEENIMAPRSGWTHTTEARQRISAAFKGKPLSPEHRRKIGESNKGKVISEEQRGKISAALKGRHPTETALKNMRLAHMGKPQTEQKRRKVSEARKGIVFTEDHKRKLREARIGRFGGDKHPNWQGGISFEPYCVKFNDEFKERVRGFFNHRCVECGTPQNGSKLLIHHVNFDKKTCCNDNKPLFVPPCRSCHSKTNFNRDYWQDRYTRLINEQNGGMCYLPKPEAPHVN
jgi:hypothetical protein